MTSVVFTVTQAYHAPRELICEESIIGVTANRRLELETLEDLEI
jgi:hypothetical protein